MTDPQQELFSILLKNLRECGFDVYDEELPDSTADYPFIYMGDTQQSDKNLKSIITGKVFQTVHVWHNNPRQRGTVSAMILKIKETARHIKGKFYHWDLMGLDQRILMDDSTDKTLVHGVISLEFSFD